MRSKIVNHVFSYLPSILKKTAKTNISSLKSFCKKTSNIFFWIFFHLLSPMSSLFCLVAPEHTFVGLGWLIAINYRTSFFVIIIKKQKPFCSSLYRVFLKKVVLQRYNYNLHKKKTHRVYNYFIFYMMGV